MSNFVGSGVFGRYELKYDSYYNRQRDYYIKKT